MENKESIGAIIADARKRKGLTQGELAKLLYVSDKAISNWENGKNYPDISVFQNISDCLDIDLLSILARKKDKKKFIKLVFRIVFILLVISFIILFTFFISNYNKINYYSISLNSDEYSISNSNLIIGNNKIILNLGQLSFAGDLDVNLYYLKDGVKKDIITEYDYDGLTLTADFNNNIYFDKSMFSNLNNFYIKVKSFDKSTNKKEDTILNLVFENVIQSNRLFYKHENGNHLYKKRTITLLENVGYKKSNNNTYIKDFINDNGDLINLIYFLDELKFKYKKQSNDLITTSNLNMQNNSFECIIEYKNVVVEHFIFSDSLTCLVGNCDNYDELKEELYFEYNKVK